MFRNFFKRRKKVESNSEFWKKFSEISRQQSEMGKQIFQISENLAELSKQVSQLSEEVSNDSKKISILIRARDIEKEWNQKTEETEKTLKKLFQIKSNKTLFGKDEFREVITEIREGKILPHQQKIASFFLDIVRILPEKASGPKHFETLSHDLWKDLSLRWGELSEDICHIALSVLENDTDILKRQYAGGKRFYLFNPDSEFYQNHR